MKKILSILLILTMILSFTACGGDDSDKKKEKITNDLSIFQSHNTPSFTTGSESTSKLAFPFKNEIVGDCVVTIDFEGVSSNDFAISPSSMGTDFFNITNYDYEKLVLEAALSAFVFRMELSTGLMEKEELYRNGRWVLRRTDASYIFYLYYIFDDSENLYNLRFVINNPDEEAAILYAENFSNIFHFYKASSGDFVNVKDISGNPVSLSDYRFYKDMVTVALKNDGLVISDSSFVGDYTNGTFNVSVPYEEATISYTIQRTKEKYSDKDYEVINVFGMNDNTVQMIETMSNEIKRYYVAVDDSYYKINASYPMTVSTGSQQKIVFVDHFN